MRSVFFLFSALAVMALAFWAYRENYATQNAAREAARLTREIGRLNEAIAVQRAEWAWLNRPDRLSELVEANFDRLGLMPMTANQFARIHDLPMPLPPDPAAGLAEEIDAVVELAAEAEEAL
ncbi:MAG: cell division protein FtsL [Gemmobacter sp.]